jgi:hypothetical protein
VNRRLPSQATRDKQILTACLRADIFRAAEDVARARLLGAGEARAVDILVEAVVEYQSRKRCTASEGVRHDI